MQNFYVYLISSLPYLSFGAKPPFSLAGFLDRCSGLIGEEELLLLKKITKESGYEIESTANPALAGWHAFDVSLRNELVRARATRTKKDPVKYLRDSGHDDYEQTHIAMSAYRNPAILDAERFLDMERWRFLDELSLGHYFDQDILIIYALKLVILARWDRIRNPAN